MTFKKTLICTGLLCVVALIPGSLFFNNNKESKEWKEVEGTWKVENGEIASQKTESSLIFLKNLPDSNFELQVDMMIETRQTEVKVIYRATPSSPADESYQGYSLQVDPHSHQIIWNSNQNGLHEIARRPFLMEERKWYQMRLIVNGENLKCYLDNIQVTPHHYPKVDGIDARFKRGMVGLQSQGGIAHFRNFSIRPYKYVETKSTYTNPVQPGCADPVVFKYKNIYYAYCTYTPDFPKMTKGIRMYSSGDLVHWKDEGYVLKKEDSWGESGFWAPDIIEKNGIFYLYYAVNERTCVATSLSPRGPFKQLEKKPMLPESIRIDTHIFRDDDGQCYIYYGVFQEKSNEIWGGKLNADMLTVDKASLQLMIKPDQEWERQRKPVVEGPMVIKHKGIYYLTYSGSHFKSPDYAVGYATSDSPLGPWKKYDLNPIMKSTSYAHGTAHHTITTSPDEQEMFIIYHRHFSLSEVEPRQMAIDRIQFVPQKKGPDLLEVWGPTSSPQPLPSGSRELQ